MIRHPDLVLPTDLYWLDGVILQHPFRVGRKDGGGDAARGDKATYPLAAGQTIVAHGVFDDYTETDSAIFVVLRSSGKHHAYDFAPLGCVDPFWSDHLKRNPSCTGKVMTRWGEKVPPQHGASDPLAGRGRAGDRTCDD